MNFPATIVGKNGTQVDGADCSRIESDNIGQQLDLALIVLVPYGHQAQNFSAGCPEREGVKANQLVFVTLLPFGTERSSKTINGHFL
jgi:hypothetical protein